MCYQDPEQVIALVEKALKEDVDYYMVINRLEKALLHQAIKRHTTLRDAYTSIRLSKSSFFNKKGRFFADTEPASH